MLGVSLDSFHTVFTIARCIQFSSVQFSRSSCPTLCDPMNRSMPGLPVHHQLLDFTQTHVHRVSDAIQPSHPLSSPSPPAPNPSQHQSLFQCVTPRRTDHLGHTVPVQLILGNVTAIQHQRTRALQSLIQAASTSQTSQCIYWLPITQRMAGSTLDSGGVDQLGSSCQPSSVGGVMSVFGAGGTCQSQATLV